MDFRENIKKLLGIYIITLGGLLQVNGATTTQLTQYGITWEFSAPVEYGQFVNGDYYVVQSGPGVTVSSISPSSASGRNGSMVNPVTKAKQAYDDRLPYYSAADAISFPATLSAGDSLVSTISLTSGDEVSGKYLPSWDSRTISTNFAKLKTAAVLTVLSSAPPAGSFRPPFIGSDKPIYNVSQIQPAYLPAVPAPSAAPPKPVSYYERGLERPWLTHIVDWQCRYLHPIENMLNYHREIGTFLSEASMIMVTELATPELIHNYIQTGIDQYHMAKSGNGDSAFFEWQVIHTGLLLGDADIADMFVNGTNKTVGRATEKFYYWSDKKSTIASKIVPPGETWTGATVFFRKQKGNTEHEHLHPSEWGQVDNGGGSKQENYRHCCDSRPHMGMALASRMLGASGSHWPDRRLDDYLERWMTEDWGGTWKPIASQYYSSIPDSARSMGSPFGNEMWVLYNNYDAGSSAVTAKPVMSPPAGWYLDAQDVELFTATPDATIYYSLDGSTPTQSSLVYTGPIAVFESMTIKALAVAPSMGNSGLSSGKYTVGHSPEWTSSSSQWGNEPISVQTESFKVTFRLTPAFNNLDGVVGFSDIVPDGNPVGYSALATTVRFNEGGTIDARNGSLYQAENILGYSEGTVYNVEMDVDMVNKTYDVRVDGVVIAEDYSFRNGTEGVSQLDNLAYFSSFDGMFFTIEDLVFLAEPSAPSAPTGLRVVIE